MLLVFLLLTLLVAVAGGAYAYALKAAAARAETDGRLRAAVAAAEQLLPAGPMLRDALTGADIVSDPQQWQSAFSRYCRLLGLGSISVYLFEGDAPKLAAGAVIDGQSHDPGRDTLRQALTAARTIEREVAGERVRTLLQPGPAAGSRYVIAATEDAAAFDAALVRALWQAIWVGMTVFMVGMLISSLLAWRIARPISATLAAVRRMREGDYGVRLGQEGGGELGELARNFNAMSEAVAERERLMLRQAFEDRLTGLPNRTRLLELMQSGMASDDAPFVLLLLDINQFRYVNDYLGYPAGDAMLVALARRLSGLMQQQGELCARLPGDEFALLFPRTRIDALPSLLARLDAALLDPVMVGGQRLDLGVGIGVAVYPEHGETAELLLRHAEMAMYLAKRDHTAYAIYCPETQVQRRNRTVLLADLREAIEDGQFRVHYQPKARLGDGSVDKAEALIRWAHPERGWIAPDEFIPFAEQTGRLHAITHWVVNEVVGQLARWREGGLMLCVSVNVSTGDVEDDTFVTFIDNTLQRHDVPPSQLCLEITETGMMHRPQQLLRNLDRLRQLGVLLSIDDFGNGYSSFGYLAQMPVHELKIDRTFIERLGHNFENVSIVRSIIELGHILGLEVVAEGVETAAIWQALAVMGCDAAQGYLIARPMPADELRHWMTLGFELPSTPPNMAPLLAS
ncbi:hypothetical protein BJP62_17625 [Jeongeupia sp. USM3]|nr:hypothetical protein BJP62_17625 [Jeongeupia sp. USM3]